MDSTRPHDPRLYRGQPAPASPQASGRQATRRTSPSVYPYEQSAPASSTYPYEQSASTSSTYPYEQQAPRPPAQQRAPHDARPTGQQGLQRNRAPRRVLGIVVFLLLTGLSLPLHVAAIFFIYVEFESPGDPAMAALLIGGAFLGSFAALLATGIVAQLAGGFPGRWRARITLAALSGIIALVVAYFAALQLF